MSSSVHSFIISDMLGGFSSVTCCEEASRGACSSEADLSRNFSTTAEELSKYVGGGIGALSREILLSLSDFVALVGRDVLRSPDCANECHLELAFSCSLILMTALVNFDPLKCQLVCNPDCELREVTHYWLRDSSRLLFHCEVLMMKVAEYWYISAKF